jgi:hypothetical protein
MAGADGDPLFPQFRADEPLAAPVARSFGRTQGVGEARKERR